MMRTAPLLIGTLLSITLQRAPAQAPTPASQPTDTSALAVVRRYFVAYNAQDVDGVMSLLSPDITWLSVAGDSVSIESRGAAALRTYLTGYFKRLPSSRSEMETSSVLGPWVSARERASWTAATSRRTQASMSVYEVRDGLIRRVWYYPAAR